MSGVYQKTHPRKTKKIVKTVYTNEWADEIFEIKTKSRNNRNSRRTHTRRGFKEDKKNNTKKRFISRNPQRWWRITNKKKRWIKSRENLLSKIYYWPNWFIKPLIATQFARLRCVRYEHKLRSDPLLSTIVAYVLFIDARVVQSNQNLVATVYLSYRQQLLSNSRLFSVVANFVKE